MVREFKSDLYDLAIVGAGIIGTLAAYEINQLKPDWEIICVDRSMIGHGATLYSLGVQFPFGKTLLKKQLTEQSLKGWERLTSEIPDLPIQPLSFMGITHNSHLENILNGFVEGSAHILENEKIVEFKKKYPWMLLDPTQILIEGTKASYSNTLEVTTLISQKLKAKQNINIYEGLEIQELKQNQDFYTLTTSTEQLINAKRVLITIGPWLVSGSMNSMVQEKNIRTKKIVSFHINQVPTKVDPLIFFFDEQAFLLPDIHSKQWFFSFTAEEWDCKPDIQALTITKADQTLAFSILEKYCPTLIEHCRGGRVFCDAYTPQLTPLVFEAPNMPKVMIAGAGSGSGFRLAPAIASIASNEIKLL